MNHDARQWPLNERQALADQLLDAAEVDLLRGDHTGALQSLEQVVRLGLEDPLVLEQVAELLLLAREA